MNAEFRFITPEEASAMLAKRPLNRKIVTRRVTALAEQMKSGEWKDDGAPIRLGKVGDLLDGQHRLSAIVLSGIPQWLLVVTGIDPETLLIMDTGKSRSFDDYLTLKGISNARKLASATSFLWKYQNAVLSYRGDVTKRPKPTMADLWETFQKHTDDLVDGAAQGARIASRNRMAPAVANGLWVVLASVDYEDAEEFYAQLAGHSFPLCDGVVALSRRLERAGKSGQAAQLDQRDQAAVTIKGWNVFREGGCIKIIQWRPGGAHPESFPTPI